MAWKPFSSNVEDSIVQAITQAEAACSGEVRVRIDQYCKGDPVFKATNVFHHLGMDQTELRNGVLIYVAIKDKKFSIIGDEGIDNKVPDNFWEETKNLMTAEFRKGDITNGIIIGVQHAGEQLAKYFPPDDSKGNELPDDISYGS